jgi:hypothetical protein
MLHVTYVADATQRCGDGKVPGAVPHVNLGGTR